MAQDYGRRLMLRVFIGYDHRQPISYNVLQHSIFRHASEPVAIIALKIDQLPLKRTGLTPFTFSRFIVPYLCDYEGWGLFLDSDMLVTHDIANLFNMADDEHDIMVVKNPIHKFEWASVMLFNNAKCKVLTPEYIETADKLHSIGWSDNIGDLPLEWNHLVGYDSPKQELPKLIHYTQGVPCFNETNTSEYAKEWISEFKLCSSAVTWETLMGNSVHAVQINNKKMPKYLIDIDNRCPYEEHKEKVKELLTENKQS